MKEKFEELYDGLKERLKSSFLLTFIIIWLLHHWRLIFSIFNFDANQSLVSKRFFIAKYISEEGMLWLWLFPLFWTFCSMVLFYSFSGLSELINIRYHNLRKKIYNRWENKKIKTIEEYEEQVEENKKLQLLITDLEKGRETLLNSTQNLDKTIGDQNKLLANNRTTIENYRKQIKELTEDKDKLIYEANQGLLEEKNEATQISKKYQDYYGRNQDFNINVEIPVLILMAKLFGINNKALLESQQGQDTGEPRDLMEGIWIVHHFQDGNMSGYNESRIKIENRNIHDMKKDSFLGAIKSFTFNRRNKITSFVISNRDKTDINVKLIVEHQNRLHGFWNDQIVRFQRDDKKL